MAKKKWQGKNNSDSGGFYFVGFLGSFVYYMQLAEGFGSIITGFLKSLIWPATIAYKLLESFYGVA